jgi:hypothetical protein
LRPLLTSAPYTPAAGTVTVRRVLLVGPLALRTLEPLAFDCFVMSIDGIA